MLVIKLVGRVGLHNGLNKSMMMAAVQERELVARDTALLLLEGNRGF